MIQAITASGINYDIDENTLKYLTKKISSLDHYMPNHARKSATAEVKMRMVNRDHGNKYEVEVIINVPDKTLTAKDSTVNMLAAIDIVEAKLITQLRKYKQEVLPYIGRRRFLSRFKACYVS